MKDSGRLERKTPLKRTQMKKRLTKRDWSDAEYKRKPCRVCGIPDTELAHTIRRDKQDKVRTGPRGGEVLWVNPSSVIPLCSSHHRDYDQYRLSILEYLTLEEELNAVEAAGSIASAYRRLTGGTT